MENNSEQESVARLTDDRAADIAPHLGDGETVLESRGPAFVSRVAPDGSAATGEPGQLYLTTSRLIHFGGPIASIPLSEVVEVTVSGERLLVTLTGPVGVIVEVHAADEFRGRIAGAIGAMRRRQAAA